MTRSDRLAEILVLLRMGNMWRAEDLAKRFSVSVRTIYRDMDTLGQSGIPIEGERGVGYLLPPITTLPPLNLTKAELEALHVGLAAVGTVDNLELRAAAASLSHKVDQVLAVGRQDQGANFGFATYPFDQGAKGFQFLPVLRAAIKAGQKLRVTFISSGEVQVLHPYHLDYVSRFWVLRALSETTGIEAEYRLEKFNDIRPLPATFTRQT